MVGGVCDPCHLSFQDGMRAEFAQRNLYAVLDPLMLELDSAGGHTASRSKLPWADQRVLTPSDFDATRIDAVSGRIAEFVAQKKFNAVIAPAHYLRDGHKDAWVKIDRSLTVALRRRLNSSGCTDTAIFYPLATSTQHFLEPAHRVGLKAFLSGLPIQALWLRIHPFGSQSGDATLRRYISACQDLHGLRIPLVAEKTGSLGLALLAFGAVAAIENGVSSGEKFDFGRLSRPPTGKTPFAPRPRVYIPSLGIFLPPDQAQALFDNRGLRQFACRNTACCPRGSESMIKNPRRHFVFTRMDEVGMLSALPQSLRIQGYMERLLRPATDNIGRAMANDKLDDATKQKLEKHRRKLDGWRATLGQLGRLSPPRTVAAPLERRIVRVRATA